MKEKTYEKKYKPADWGKFATTWCVFAIVAILYAVCDIDNIATICVFWLFIAPAIVFVSLLSIREVYYVERKK